MLESIKILLVVCMSNSSDNPITQYNLRWSEELKEKVVEASKNSSRSINQEIVARLEQSFEGKAKPPVALLLDVELLFFGPLPFDVHEQDFQNLIVQFPVGQIPNKGDLINVEALRALGGSFRVKEKIYDISLENIVQYTLVIESPEDL
jgi:hypothetical protein